MRRRRYLLALSSCALAGCLGGPDQPAPAQAPAPLNVKAAKPTPGDHRTLRARFRYQDFDGDGKADLVYFGHTDGLWHILPSSGGDEITVSWGYASDVLVPGQYDSDLKADVAVYRPSEGNWYVIPSTTGSAFVTNYGNAQDIPVPGDYDGDGKIEAAVFRPSEGNWYIQPSGGGAQIVVNWGDATDRVVPGDYDGDGKTDIAIFRNNDNGNTADWYIIPSSTGTPYVVNWGQDGDNPVVGDYDGDGADDVAIYRPSTSEWWILPSSTGYGYTLTLGNHPKYGNSQDYVVPGDYDGDRKTDPAVFNPLTGQWLILSSSTGYTSGFTYGSAGDSIPYHPYSGGCGGPNLTNARLTAPYNCTWQDFQWMLKTGWPYNYQRGLVVSEMLGQLTDLPSPNQPENSYVDAIGRCDKTATDYYDGPTNEWCSEFVRDMYLWSGHSMSDKLFQELCDVSDVDDLRHIFAERGELSERATAGWFQPGDYIAGVNGEGQHNGHSMMVYAVSDDARFIYILAGNTGFNINNVSHRCVAFYQHPYFTNGVLDPKFDAFGIISSW